MACLRFADALKDHAAGADLPPGARAHVERCADCREQLARERDLVADITGGLERALRLEPSVEFAAHVRERIAAEAAAPTWWRAWRLALGIASLVLVAALVATMLAVRTGAPPRVPDVAKGPEPLERVPRNPAVADPIRATAPLAGMTANRTEAVRARPSRSREPEVLIARDQQVAMARLFEMLRTGKLDEKVLVPGGQQDATVGQPVAPIVVGDLAVPTIEVAPATAGKTN